MSSCSVMEHKWIVEVGVAWGVTYSEIVPLVCFALPSPGLDTLDNEQKLS